MSTATVVESTRCPECAKQGKDTSGNNYKIYSDGTSHCYGCGYHPSNGNSEFLQGDFPEVLIGRNITKDVLKFFNYQVGYFTGKIADELVENEKVHIANICDSTGSQVAQQLRASGKRFKFLGKAKGLGLVGTHLWEPTPLTFVTIVEGYIDQLSVAQAQGTRFPVLTVPAGVGSAVEAVTKDAEYLAKFKHVVLAFDNDDAGREAAMKCAKLLPPGKAKIATWPMKDANDSLVAGDIEGIRTTLFNAKTYHPEGVMSVTDIPIEDYRDMYREGTSIPFPKLNSRLGGLQSGALYTIVAQEKAGKSLLTKEMVLHLLNQDKKVGVLYLEEGAPEAMASLVAMSNDTPAWKLRNDERLLGGPEGINEALAKYKDNLYVYHHKGVIDLTSVLNAIQYMTTALKCEFIVLDNTSLAIAGGEGAKGERQIIENFIFKLVAICNNTKAAVINVCHVTKNRRTEDGGESQTITRSDIFGSGAFAKFSYAVIALERDWESNKSRLKILADRGPGGTGYADTLTYNQTTGRLECGQDSDDVLE